MDDLDLPICDRPLTSKGHRNVSRGIVVGVAVLCVLAVGTWLRPKGDVAAQPSARTSEAAREEQRRVSEETARREYAERAASSDEPAKWVAAPCEDIAAAKSCKEWVAEGECGRNPTYMRRACKKSCGLCSADSSTSDPPAARPDSQPSVASARPAAGSEPSPSAGSVGGGAPSAGSHAEAVRLGASADKSAHDDVAEWANGPTVGYGAPEDHDEHCADWARKGECKSNPNYMRLRCKKSCIQAAKLDTR